MVFYEHLGTAFVPGGVEIRLYKHENDYSILLPDDELMSTRMRASEDLLAVESLKRVAHTATPRMLIGGYGMGYTLRAALAAGGPGLEVVVSEIVPEIIQWALGPMAEVTSGCLHDPRVRVDLRDVGAAIFEAYEAFDTILLDVDNGPDGVTRPGNDGLYSAAGIKRAWNALRPKGVLAIWSAKNDAGFTRRLKRCGFAVEVVSAKSRPDGTGPRHVIWFARKPG